MGPGRPQGGGRTSGQQASGRHVEQWRRHVARREEEEEGGLRSLWRSLVHRLMKKGLTEVTLTHPKFGLLENIRSSLQTALGEGTTVPKFQLSADDYEHRETHIIKNQQEAVRFKVYAPAVFATIRTAFGVGRREFLTSVAPPTDLPYLRYVSNSSGKHDFYFSNDKRFIFKTEPRLTTSTFLDMLEDYLGHFIKNPHSLIVKIFGVFSIQIEENKPVYFIVMQSVFYPDQLLSVRYDIKGCLAGRYQSPGPAQDGENLQVFKDQNFKKERLALGTQRSWFVTQVWRDTEFLKAHNIVDYSLLVGIQKEFERQPVETDFDVNHLNVESNGVRVPTPTVQLERPAEQNGEKQDGQVENAKLDFAERKALWSSLVKFVDNAEYREYQSKATESKDDSLLLEKIRIESRLSNISALVELLGDGSQKSSPARKNGSSASNRKTITILKRFLTPSRDKAKKRGAINNSPSSTPTDSFQVHPPPLTSLSSADQNSLENGEAGAGQLETPRGRYSSGNGGLSVNRFLSSVLRPSSRFRVHPTSGKAARNSHLPSEFELEHANGLPRLNGISSPPLYRSPRHNTVITENTVDDLHQIKRASENHFSLENWQQALDSRDSNRRTLPDDINAVHIVDGSDTRYFFGIIDIFTTYGWRQRLVRVMKNIKFCGGDHSSLGPDLYADRFIHFIDDHVV